MCCGNTRSLLSRAALKPLSIASSLRESTVSGLAPGASPARVGSDTVRRPGGARTAVARSSDSARWTATDDEIDTPLPRWTRTVGDEEDDWHERFEYLDIDCNGWIEAGEWSVTVTAFNWLDLDHDNRLSRDEFGSRVIDRGIRTLPMTGKTVLVEAWERWSDTGIDVQARDLLLFEASGTIRVGDSAGDVATANGARGHRTLDVPMLTQRAGALIGRIGHGPPFFVGSSRSVLAPTIGRLYLGVNDDDFRDNVGYFEVMITIQ